LFAVCPGRPLATLDRVRWGDETVSDGVLERAFELTVSDRRVPGLLWLPPGARGSRPLVLIGHGGAGTKREGFVLALARRLVRERQVAAAAIDGPIHGDRRPDRGSVPGLALLEFSQRWAGDPTMTDSMIEDWVGTVDALRQVEGVGEGPLGWWGLSMGTIIGLPLVVADPRFDVAVLGLMGLTGPTSERIAHDAPLVRCPVMFLVQWDDELFPRDTGAELFDLIGTPDKRLLAHVGRHGQVPDEAFEASERFLAARLCGDRPGTPGHAGG
jgi:dienelactone hydrolase